MTDMCLASAGELYAVNEPVRRTRNEYTLGHTHDISPPMAGEMS